MQVLEHNFGKYIEGAILKWLKVIKDRPSL